MTQKTGFQIQQEKESMAKVMKQNLILMNSTSNNLMHPYLMYRFDLSDNAARHLSHLEADDRKRIMDNLSTIFTNAHLTFLQRDIGRKYLMGEFYESGGTIQ